MFIREIWEIFTSFIFWNFPLKHVIISTNTFLSTITEWNKLDHCSNFSSAQNTLLNETESIDKSIIEQDENKTKLFKLSFMVIQLILSITTT